MNNITNHNYDIDWNGMGVNQLLMEESSKYIILSSVPAIVKLNTQPFILVQISVISASGCNTTLEIKKEDFFS